MYRLVGQVRCCHGGHIPCATGNELHRHVLGLLIACAALVEPVSPVQTNTNALRGARMVLEEEKPASEACIFDSCFVVGQDGKFARIGKPDLCTCNDEEKYPATL